MLHFCRGTPSDEEANFAEDEEADEQFIFNLKKPQPPHTAGTQSVLPIQARQLCSRRAAIMVQELNCKTLCDHQRMNE